MDKKRMRKQDIKIISKIKGKGIAYDGCHKIYVCKTSNDILEALELKYMIHPMEDLQELYEISCPLRFINSWDTKTTYIAQR